MPAKRTGSRAVIYCRLSPSPTLTRTENLEQQESLSRGLCEAKGWDVVAVIVDDDHSASKGKRPGWERAVELVRTGQVDVIASRHADRMYRQPRELEDLVDLAESTGVLLATVQGDYDLTTPNGRMVARMLGAAARNEMEMKAERQRMGHQRRTAAGRPWWTSRPFGFERDGSHRSEEAEAIRKAYGDVLAGVSLYAIANGLNKAGIVSPKGNPWRSANLRHVLMHPRNAAIHTYRGDETGSEPTWEPIVGEDVYRAVVQVLGDASRVNNGGGRRKGLLTGAVVCSKCGGSVIQNWSKPNKAGDRYRIYICREGRCISIPADWLESHVVRKVIDNAHVWAGALEDTSPEIDLAALRAEEASLLAANRALAEMFAMSQIDKASLLAGTTKATERVQEIREQLAQAGVARGGVDIADLELLWQTVDELDPERLRSIIETATTRIVLLPRGKGSRQPKGENVEVVLRVAT